jgi:hypothetical protein
VVLKTSIQLYDTNNRINYILEIWNLDGESLTAISMQQYMNVVRSDTLFGFRGALTASASSQV